MKSVTFSETALTLERITDWQPWQVKKWIDVVKKKKIKACGILVEFARDDNNKRTSCRLDNQRLLIFQKRTFKELYTGIPSDNWVIVLYLQTVANIYSNSDLCYNKTPKVVSVGCVGPWKHNGVLSEFGKIRETGKTCHVMSTQATISPQSTSPFCFLLFPTTFDTCYAS